MERGPGQPRSRRQRLGSSARGLSTRGDAYSLLMGPRPPPPARAAPRRGWAWRACSPRASPAAPPTSASAAPPAPPPPCCGVRVKQPRPYSAPHSELPPAAQRRERGPPHCAGARSTPRHHQSNPEPRRLTQSGRWKRPDSAIAGGGGGTVGTVGVRSLLPRCLTSQP